MRIPFSASVLLLSLLLQGIAFAAAPDDPAAQRAALAAYLEGTGQALVEKAVWNSPRSLAVGIHYMGSEENGVADDICKVLQEHGLGGNTQVQVIDINTMGADPKRWEVIGGARCRR